MCLLLTLFVWASAWAGTLSLHVFDVRQGDALLLETPAGKHVLIDAGTGAPDIVPMLQALGVQSLDLVIATHGHADHIGGMDEVLEAIPVEWYVDQGMVHTTATYRKVMAVIDTKQIKYRTGRADQEFKLDDGIRIELLHPGPSPLRNTRSDLNANSVVARITHGDTCMLLMGDAEDQTERVLLRNGLAPCEVLKVAHHGSKYSTSDSWLRAVQPRIVLISAGANNRYGHPAKATLDRIQRAGAQVYRTDQQGSILVESDGKHITVTAQDNRTVTEASSAETLPALEGRPDSGIITRVRGGIDLNTASAPVLDTLPGIGPAKAAAIIQSRSVNGPFASIEDLQRVSGIGPATVAAIRPYVRVAPPATAETTTDKKKKKQRWWWPFRRKNAA